MGSLAAIVPRRVGAGLAAFVLSLGIVFAFAPLPAHAQEVSGALQAAVPQWGDQPEPQSSFAVSADGAQGQAPIYRLFNPANGEHLYTTGASEKSSLLRQGWRDEGVGWVAPASSKTPVMRLFHPRSGDHHYTVSEAEKSALQRSGWRYEGVAFYSDDAKTTPIYRQFNPQARLGSHNFTANRAENRNLVRNLWRAEGVAWYGCSSPAADGGANASLDGADVYRLFNRSSHEHFFTASVAERDSLIRAGWRYEGVGWVAPRASATPVYRLASQNDHHYTTSSAEMQALRKAGWRYEGVAFYSDDGHRLAVHRQFNPTVNPRAWHNNSGAHFFTAATAERDGLLKAGWRGEGVAWYAVDGGMAVPNTDPSAAQLRARLRMTTRLYPEFDHGFKGADWQGYIMLHDTEGEGIPDNVLNGWRYNHQRDGNGVAAHFVVGMDGSILQCVDMDRIAHHAGAGTPGNGAKYGVADTARDVDVQPQNRRLGADYGMNSYSIGIEMVHLGGTGYYPEAQLRALDGLIAYIDAYYGFQSPIIDHKAWRHGNSDTSPEFARYLANYQRYRHH